MLRELDVGEYNGEWKVASLGLSENTKANTSFIILLGMIIRDSHGMNDSLSKLEPTWKENENKKHCDFP